MPIFRPLLRRRILRALYRVLPTPRRARAGGLHGDNDKDDTFDWALDKERRSLMMRWQDISMTSFDAGSIEPGAACMTLLTYGGGAAAL